MKNFESLGMGWNKGKKVSSGVGYKSSYGGRREIIPPSGRRIDFSCSDQNMHWPFVTYVCICASYVFQRVNFCR